jgi:hypothetical protein
MSPVRRSPWAGLLVLGLGCGPVVTMEDPGAAESSSGAPTDSSSGVAPVGSSSSDGADGSTSTTTDPTGYEDDGDGTGCTFTCPDPPPTTPPPGNGGWCGVECPRGEKCMPWANDGGDAWNAWRCSPVFDDPGAPGEPCTVEGSGTSGIDDCDVDTICWQVDPMTNQGVCHAICEATGGMFTCAEPFECTLLDGGVPLCVQTCDPLTPSCPAGQACAFMGADLVCQPVLGEAAALGEPCGPALACEPGTLCSFDPVISCGNAPGMGCCAQPCDVNDPVACTEPEICVPWFPLRPPPELAYLGVCATL